jgi:hypothetical protein
LCHLQKFLQYIKYIVLKFTPSSFSFILPQPIPGIISIGIIFLFSNMCTEYLGDIHPPTPFPLLLPYSLVPTPAGRTCSTLLISNFVKEKKNFFVSLT